MNFKSIISHGLLASLILSCGAAQGMDRRRIEENISAGLIGSSLGVFSCFLSPEFRETFIRSWGINAARLMNDGDFIGDVSQYPINQHPWIVIPIAVGASLGVAYANRAEIKEYLQQSKESLKQSYAAKMIHDYRAGKTRSLNDPFIQQMPFGVQMNFVQYLPETQNYHSTVFHPITTIQDVRDRNLEIRRFSVKKPVVAISSNILELLSVNEYQLLEALILAAIDTRDLSLNQRARIHANNEQWETWQGGSHGMNLRSKLPLPLQTWFDRLIVRA